jgi:hypothetical protein
MFNRKLENEGIPHDIVHQAPQGVGGNSKGEVND